MRVDRARVGHVEVSSIATGRAGEYERQLYVTCSGMWLTVGCSRAGSWRRIGRNREWAGGWSITDAVWLWMGVGDGKTV